MMVAAVDSNHLVDPPADGLSSPNNGPGDLVRGSLMVTGVESRCEHGLVHGLLELVLEVADLDRSVAFYRDLLGLAEVERWPAPRLGVWLSLGPNEVLGLWPIESGGEKVSIAGSRGGSHVHFAVYVSAGSLDDWRRRLNEASVEVVGPIDFAPGNQSLFVRDPDGNVVELGDWATDWAGEDITKRPS